MSVSSVLLLWDIISEYPELFNITKAAAKRLENTVELPIPDEEIACLALHFGAFLKIDERKTDNLRACLVSCQKQTDKGKKNHL